MFEEAISLLSIWASMNSWLTPTVLFLFLNLMIGTIAVTSGFTSHKPSHHHHLHHQSPPHQPPHNLQPQLSRSSSVLQRLKSINFYTYYSPPPTTHFQQPSHAPPSPPPQQQPEPTPEPHHPTPETTAVDFAGEVDDDENPSMDEIYSRIKNGNSASHYNRQNSDTKPSGGEIPVKLPKKMKKSASHKSAFNHFHAEPKSESAPRHTAMPTTVEEDFKEERENVGVPLFKEEREIEDHDNGVDAKADDFINRFKKQLQMQRADSIVRYKEMVYKHFAQ